YGSGGCGGRVGEVRGRSGRAGPRRHVWLRARERTQRAARTRARQVIRTTAIVLLSMAFASPAAAQRPAPRPPPRRPVRVLPPLPPEAPISFRPFVMGAENAFAAVDTFSAVFGRSYAPFFGGGLQVMFHGKY